MSIVQSKISYDNVKDQISYVKSLWSVEWNLFMTKRLHPFIYVSHT